MCGRGKVVRIQGLSSELAALRDAHAALRDAHAALGLQKEGSDRRAVEVGGCHTRATGLVPTPSNSVELPDPFAAVQVGAELDATRTRSDAALKKLQSDLAAAIAAHEAAAARLQVRRWDCTHRAFIIPCD